MPLFLNEDQAMLKDTVAPFLKDAAPVSAMRALRDEKDANGFSRDLWKQFAEMGFLGVLASEGEGGLGLGHVEAGIILEEIGRNLTQSPFLGSAVGAVTALSGADDDLRGRWMEGLVSGDKIAALAIDEGPKHRPERIGLRAERSGNGFKLSGSKSFVSFGHAADMLVVAARTSGDESDEDGVTLFAVPADASGLDATPERLADSSIAASVKFDGVELDAGNVIGDVDGGRALLQKVLRAVRTGASAELVGVGSEAMDRTLGYLKERKQFGQLIGSYQALQHRAAHLYSELEVASAAVLKAQQMLDEAGDDADERTAKAVHVAKFMAGSATVLAVQEGVQMHGGIGMTDEYDIGFYMKRHRVLEEMFGSADYHANQLALLAGF